MNDAVILRKVYDELCSLKAVVARREDVEALLDAEAIATNPATMRQLASSRADKLAGRTRAVRSVQVGRAFGVCATETHKRMNHLLSRQ